MSLATLKKAAKKPSSLIRLALEDLKACEKDPKYKVDMSRWHTPNGSLTKPVCHVCFAGAVLAKTLELPATKDESPSSALYSVMGDAYYQSSLGRQIVSLNLFRTGQVAEAVYYGWTKEFNSKEHINALNKLRKAFHKVEFEGKFLYEATGHKPLKTGGSYRTKDQRAKFRRSMADVARRLEKVGL